MSEGRSGGWWTAASLAVLVAAGVGAALLLLPGGVRERRVPESEEGGSLAAARDGLPPTLRGALLAEEDPCGGPDPARPARLDVDLPGDTLDFGDVVRGVDQERSVSFRSAGVGPLCIRRAVSLCGCVRARLEGTDGRFEPGETGHLRVGLDLRGIEGPLSKTVTLVTNEPGRPLRTLTVIARVRVGIAAQEPLLDFGRRPRNTPATAVLTLVGPGGPPWTVTGVEGQEGAPDGTAPGYTFQAETLSTDPVRRVRVVVSHPGRADLGLYRDFLRVRLDHSEQPMLRVPSVLSVAGRITSRRAGAHLGIVVPGQEGLPSRLRLEAAGPEISFAVLDTRVVPRGADPETAGTLGGLRARHGRDDPGWWVEVRWDGSVLEEGPLEGDLVVRTDDAEQPLLLFAVDAWVSPDVGPRPRPPR